MTSLKQTVQPRARSDVHGPLKVAKGDALGPHDAPEVDHPLLGVGDVAHDLPQSGPSKILSSMSSSFWPILRSIGKNKVSSAWSMIL